MLSIISLLTETGCTNSTEDSDLVLNTESNTWFEACSADVAEQRMIEVGVVTLSVSCRGSGPTVVVGRTMDSC